MKLLKLIFVFALLSTLVGCASNVKMSPQFWKEHHNKIAVTKTKAATPDFHPTGVQGLLDVAINKAANKKLATRVAQSDISWYQGLPEQFVTILNQHHKTAQKSLDLPDATRTKDYPVFARKVGVHDLLVIHLDSIGVSRPYYGFIPTGRPTAMCNLSGELIDTETNKVIWRQSVSSNEPIVGEWDQAPMYPNIMKAIALASEKAQRELLRNFLVNS